MGGKSGGGGGGGGAGKVEFPAIVNVWITTWARDVDDDIQTAKSNNPYANISAFDPTDYVDEMRTSALTLNAEAFSLSSISTSGYIPVSWNSFMDTAIAKVDNVVISGEFLEDEVSEFEIAQRDQYLHSLSRFTGGLADVNAVMGSAFVLGVAAIERQYANDVDRHRAELRAQRSKDKAAFLISATQTMNQMYQTRIGAMQTAAQLLGDVNRLAIVANKEWTESDAEYDAKEALWNLELYHYGSNILASGSGGVVGADHGLSKAQSAIGGALSIASIAAQAGAFGSGGMLGGVGGLLSGLF